MILALAVLASLLSLAAALASVVARRESAQEAEVLRRQVAALAQRLQEAERAAERAAGRAEAASHLLLEKGIASEGELEGLHDAPESERPEPQPRGSRTVH
ncbi:MAG: hypothetical protein HZB56_06730 [Deltaproteobacteria bacterium]|nr:hypothetical protein [Deltaproteobacteria bacterium]